MKTFSEIIQAASKEVKEIDVYELKDFLDSNHDFLLIDIREDREWVNGKINSAIHLGRGILEKEIESNCVNRNSEIILYCAGGVRSILAAKSLQEMGYKKVFSLAGGIGQWINAGFSIEE